MPTVAGQATVEGSALPDGSEERPFDGWPRDSMGGFVPLELNCAPSLPTTLGGSLSTFRWQHGEP